MAVDFKNQQKKQKYMLIVAVIIAIIAFVVLWFGYFNKKNEPLVGDYTGTEGIVIKKRINIRYDILENSFLKKLEPFEKIPEYEGELGRVNPFLPR